MGGSKSSCLSIIACRCGGPVDGDDHRAEEDEERKASSDKRSWSFRKRSSSRRVVINTDVSEPVLVSETKEKPETLTNNVHLSKDSAVPEKEHVQERPRVTFSLPSATEDTEEGNSSVTIENTASLQDYDYIFIQSCIRGFLARKELKRRKSIVKLQATVRGRLVRRQAVGTLRCVQAIVKMQALVRARRARRLVVKLSTSMDGYQIGDERSNPLEKGKSENPNKAYSALEKLLSNSFARQLLESSSKAKAINIKCDPSKSDSAWKWLERWMAVTTLDVGQQKEQVLDQVNQEIEKGIKLSENEKNELTSANFSVASDTELAAIETDIQNVAKNASDFEFNAPANLDYGLSSFSKDNIQSSQQIFGTTEDKTMKTEGINRSDVYSAPVSIQSQTDPAFDKADPGEHGGVTGNELSVESDGKQHLQGSRRSRNPAFAAVQSKFEELSAKSSVTKSNIYPCQDAAAAKSRQDSHSILPDSLAKTKETSSTETSAFHDTGVQVAASECGTEISISSTLDSPDRSESEGEEIVLEIGDLEREKGETNLGTGNISTHDMVVEEKQSGFVSDVPKSEVQVDDDNNIGNSIALIDSMVANGHSVETTHVTNLNDAKVKRSSEESPRSNATVPSVHGTPSSEISTNSKKTKKDANSATQKQKSLPAVKRSLSNSGNNSGGRSSTEHVPKDKNGKRRDSLGSTNTDQEPRISSSNSLPSYMQATVSARAKAHTNVSPKMSPDVHDNPTKQRHSLPAESSKLNSSPNMHRSASQTQQNSRAGTTHSPQNSADRRWQR